MVRLAWRNLWRNRRRSLLTLMAVGLGFAGVLFGQSLIKSLQGQIVEKATASITGHLEIQAAGVRNHKIPDRYIDRSVEIAGGLAGEDGVRAFGRRLLFTGLIASAAASRGTLVASVEPAREREISSIPDYITEGRFLGNDLSGRGIVLGKALAEELDVRVGEKVVLMAQSLRGNLGAENFKVTGVFRTQSQTFDTQIVIVPLKAGQNLLEAEGKVSQFVVKLRDIEEVAAEARRLEKRMRPLGAQALPWWEVDHELLGIIRFQDAVLFFVLAMVYGIMALGTWNTLTMSFHERIREFGLLQALGARPGYVMRLVLLESVLLTLLGVLLGWAVGGAAIAYFRAYGLPLPLGDSFAYFLPFERSLHLRFCPPLQALSSAAVLGIGASAALPVMWRIGSFKPCEALRYT